MITGITGTIKLYIFDELGDIQDSRSWTLHGDLENQEELEVWKTMKLTRIADEYGEERWSESQGWEWDESDVDDPAKKAQEEEARYQHFMEDIYPDVYPDWDPDDAYCEWLHELSREAEMDRFW